MVIVGHIEIQLKQRLGSQPLEFTNMDYNSLSTFRPERPSAQRPSGRVRCGGLLKILSRCEQRKATAGKVNWQRFFES